MSLSHVPAPPTREPDAEAVLDQAPWQSLAGPHRHLAEGGDLARRYPVDVSPFGAVASWEDPGVWRAIQDLVGPGAPFAAPPPGIEVPGGWRVLERVQGVQLVETPALLTRPDPEAVELGPDDVPEMLALVGRTRPGPFLPRTIELGRYVGFRREGRLVAMAGERLHPPGWTEISAVCTDVEVRGQGLATRLVLDVAHHVRERGDRVLMHASAANSRAIGLYLRLGFRLRRTVAFGTVLTPPEAAPA
ncbi:GNAT family N-acetyltransferase [Serinibacter arcticus]|uniref:Acetyltransferase n=1 Tax=Serinibacter arcticus TaxID=1655435 RepID=A0A4Z1E2N1_9MICO|nr:GNAT family N-acetyltransferase [Serinibacter arcticus]TGO05258.1 acetyltransferase [Serinibacter arcticus]